MSIINSLYSKEIKQLVDEEKQLEKIKKEFERYIFSVYEKVSIIVEIQNKIYDIKKKEKGYLKDEHHHYMVQRGLNGTLNDHFNENKFNNYYKNWINKRLKRVIHIINLEIQSKNSPENIEDDIITLLNTFQNTLEQQTNEFYTTFLKTIKTLQETIKFQKTYFSKIYPLETWSIEIHEELFTNQLFQSINQELQLLFGESIQFNENYNNLPALISKAIHETNIPDDAFLKHLIEEKISKIKQKRDNKTNNTIVCYHARPITKTEPLFPLDTKTKSSGFFIDTNKQEALQIVESIYQEDRNNLEIFELKIPENLFKYAIEDPFPVDSLKDVEEISNSYIFRPTAFPKCNEFYIKGLIECEKIPL